MMENDERNASGRRHVHSHAIMIRGAEYALHSAEESEEGQFYDCMSIILYSAFAIEAYLNRVGPELFSYWDQRVKEGTSTEAKLKIIGSALDLELDFAESPFKEFKEIFGFRNRVVHAKPEELSIDHTTSFQDGIPMPETKWEAICRLSKARWLLKQTKRMISTIHEAADLNGPPYGHRSSLSIWSPSSDNTNT